MLIESLVLICSRIIIRHVNIRNVCSLLRDAAYFGATQLVECLQQYTCVNLEALLQSGLLEELPSEELEGLAAFVRLEQLKKQPTTRSNKLVREAMEKWAEWLAMQVIPPPYYMRSSKKIVRRSPQLSPVDPVASPQLKTMPSLSLAVGTPRTPGPGVPTAEHSSFHDRALPDPSLGAPTTAWRQKRVSQSLEKSVIWTIVHFG